MNVVRFLKQPVYQAFNTTSSDLEYLKGAMVRITEPRQSQSNSIEHIPLQRLEHTP